MKTELFSGRSAAELCQTYSKWLEGKNIKVHATSAWVDRLSYMIVTYSENETQE